MKRFRKALSLLIAFLIPISSIQAFGLEFRNENETSGTSETDNTFSHSPFEFVPEEGDLTLEELKEAELDRSDVPFEISYELAQSRLHVNRLYSQEPDDYTVMFQNRDGSKTIYVFSEKVKGRILFSQGRPEDTKEIEIASGQLVFNRVNKALSRLDSRCNEKKLFYYNIGHADIQYFNGRLSSGGTDITDDVREWTSGRMIPGKGNSFSAMPEDNSQNPSAGLAFSYTYSEIAGVMSLRNSSTNTYLKQYGTGLTMGGSDIPGGRWVVCYQNNYLYKIKLLQAPSQTTLYLAANTGLTSVELTSSPQLNKMFWIFDSYSSNNSSTPDYYYLRPYSGQQMAMNSSLGFTNVTSGTPNSSCGWILDNRIAIASYIGYQESAPLHAGAPIDNILTINPTGAMAAITWYYSNGTEVGFDSEQGEYRTIETDGIYKVRFSEWYSGIAMDPGEDEPINVVVYGNTEFNARATYMIRPTNYSDLSRTLVLTSSSATATSLSISDYSGNANSNYKEEWEAISRTFTIEPLLNGKNRIAATLASNQYNSSVPTFHYSIEWYNSQDWSTYVITDQSATNNYLSSAGTTSGISSAEEWYIVPVGTMTHSTGLYKKYAIVTVTDSGTMNCLKWTASGGVTYGSCTSDNVSLWVISLTGIYAPLIKQTKTFWCGYATLLQAIYGAGTEQALINSISSGGSSLHKQQNKLKESLGYSDSMNEDSVCNDINNGELPYGVFDKDSLQFNMIQGSSLTESGLKNTVLSSFETGWCPFFLTSTGHIPYKNYVNEFSHYILIIGYDKISNTIIISNCHYLEDLHSVFTIPLSTFKPNVDRLYYVTED